MVLEFLDIELMDSGIALWNLLIIAITVVTGIIVAGIAKMIFTKKFAPQLSKDTAKSLTKFIYYGIIIISLLAAASSQGLDLTGLLLAGGIFGVVIGFATQSVVSNLISGIFLLIEKPVKQGQNVEIPDIGVYGKLLDVGSFSSQIQQFDGTVIRIPNEKFFTSNLRTFSLSEVRRSDVTVGIAYGADIDKAIRVIKDAIRKKVTYALMEPEPYFWVSELADSSVNILVRVWHPRDDWGEVVPMLLKNIKMALDGAGIEIPFPQRVIHSAKE